MASCKIYPFSRPTFSKERKNEKHEMKHLSPPAVAKTGISEEIVLVSIYEEFNCKSKEKNRRAIARVVRCQFKFL